MKKTSAYFEKYTTVPSPKRDYCGIKVFEDEVVLYTWKISHGPHLSPVIRVVKNSAFNRDKTLQEEIQYIFGLKALKYVQLLTTVGTKTLLTLPEDILKKLVKYLSFKDIYQLLRVSSISHEVFSSDVIWESLFKRAKRSTKLTEMEKDLASKQGFKKLTKDHHIRTFTKKKATFTRDVPKKVEASAEKIEKIPRSASVDISKTSLQTNIRDTMKKQGSGAIPKELHRPKKLSVAESHRVEEKIFDSLKKTSSEGRTRLSEQTRNFMERFAAGENFQNFKISSEPLKKGVDEEFAQFQSKLNSIEKSIKSFDLQGYQNRGNSTIEPSNLSPSKSRNLRKSQGCIPKAVESNITKKPTFTVGSLKTRTIDKTPKQRRESLANPSSLGIRNSLDDDRDDELDDCGMSFLMRRYLETSNDTAKKFSETDYVARHLKNSSIQVDMKETSLNKQVKSVPKNKPVEKSTLRTKTNGPTKSRLVKKK